MSSQASIKRIRALHRKKERAHSGLAIAQGEKVVGELLASDLTIKEVHVLNGDEDAFDISSEVPMHLASTGELSKMSTLQTGVNAVAVFKQPDHGTPEFNEKKFWLACDAVADPGNLGTIFRSVDFFGIDGILLGRGCVDPFNPKCVQAAMGSVFRVPFHELDLSQDIPESVPVFSAEMNGESFHTIDLHAPVVLVLGNEGHGVTAEIPSKRSFTIPGSGNAELLNVSMAATVICAELHRRAITD